jgi:hypothetical protein
LDRALSCLLIAPVYPNTLSLFHFIVALYPMQISDNTVYLLNSYSTLYPET